MLNGSIRNLLKPMLSHVPLCEFHEIFAFRMLWCLSQRVWEYHMHAWWGKNGKLESSFLGSVGVWRENLELEGNFVFLYIKKTHEKWENWPASWEINTFSSPDHMELLMS